LTALANALAESFVDSFKTELIADRVWRTRTQLELAIVEWVGWFNSIRLHSSLKDLSPLQFEELSNIHRISIKSKTLQPSSFAILACCGRVS
jgi:transposase InsO family protein